MQDEFIPRRSLHLDYGCCDAWKALQDDQEITSVDTFIEIPTYRIVALPGPTAPSPSLASY